MHSTPLSLLERLRDNADEPAWTRLFGLYTPLVRTWLGRLDVPPDDAEDLLQDVCAAIARDLPAFEHMGRTGAFRNWVRMIVVNRSRGYWRARKTHPQRVDAQHLDLLEDPESDMSRFWDREHDEFVAARLLSLIRPEFAASTWQAFQRQVIDGASAADVARELALSVNAVLIAKSRVLRRLREEGRGLIDAPHSV